MGAYPYVLLSLTPSCPLPRRTLILLLPKLKVSVVARTYKRDGFPLAVLEVRDIFAFASASKSHTEGTT